MSHLGKGLVGVLLTISTACLSVVPALASPPKGNAAAIAFERSTIRAYTHVPGERVVQQGGIWLKETSNGGFSFRVGQDWAPKGYSYASNTWVAAMRGGKVVWESEILAPSCAPGSGVCVSYGSSVEMLFTKSKRYWRWNTSGTKASCFYPGLTGGDPVGHATWSIDNEKFASIATSGRMVVVTGSYKWGKYQTATETDTMFARSRLVSSETVSVSKGKGAHEPAFTETYTFENLNYTPSEPNVTVC